MTGKSRPLASLTPGLLARKGDARPAMRPQLQWATAAPADDLGWNDMGAPAPQAAPPPAPSAIVDAPEPAAVVPPVLLERDALARAIQAPPATRGVSVRTAERLRRETAHAGKAALTLRLDADRHLRLRLAGAVSNRSAQQLLTQALDALIVAMPVVADLVDQLPPTPTNVKPAPARRRR